MQFLSPGLFWLSLLAVVPVLLYLFRRKSRTVRVSTLVFFKSLAREHQESAWLRRLKRLLSLLLALLILFGGILALARLVVAPAGSDARSVVVLLDRSASMAATGSEGATRLEEAVGQIRGRLAALPESTPVALVAYDSRPEVLEPRTTNRRALLRTLEAVGTRPVADDREAALAAAVQVARLDAPSEIWHASDRPGGAGGAAGEGLELLPEGVSLAPIDVGLADPVNVGITAFQIRPVPLEYGKLEAYVQVALSSGAPGPLEVVLEVSVGGGIAVPRKLDLEPGARQGLILPVEGSEGQVLRISVGVPGDCFALDNQVVARLPETRPIVVRWISDRPDPFTRLALNAIATAGEIDVWQGGGDAWPPADRPDVVVFEGWLPDEWPDDIPAIVINPPGSIGPVRAEPIGGNGVPHGSVRVANAGHPLLYRVSSGRVALTQTAILDASGSLEPIWFGGSEPVLAAGEVGGQRLVLMGFAAERSEQLPLMPSYPLLLGNALYWCAEQNREDSHLAETRSGTLVPAGGFSLSWEEIGEDGVLRESVAPLAGTLAELDRIGLWKTEDGRQGSSLLLSSHETDLAGRGADGEDEGVGEGAGESASGGAGGQGVADEGSRFFHGELTIVFLVAIFLALVVESWLFHRHGVY